MSGDFKFARSIYFLKVEELELTLQLVSSYFNCHNIKFNNIDVGDLLSLKF